MIDGGATLARRLDRYRSAIRRIVAFETERLRELGVPEDDLPELAESAASRPGNRANPRPATPAEIEELLRSVF